MIFSRGRELLIRTHLDQLRQTGHPKWKEVNLNEAVGLWKPDRCSHSGKEIRPSTVNIDHQLETLLRNR